MRYVAGLCMSNSGLGCGCIFNFWIVPSCHFLSQQDEHHVVSRQLHVATLEFSFPARRAALSMTSGVSGLSSGIGTPAPKLCWLKGSKSNGGMPNALLICSFVQFSWRVISNLNALSSGGINSTA